MAFDWKWDEIPQEKLSPADRKNTFNEFAFTYALEEAMAEAQRCLQCPNAPCQIGCPAHNPIRDYNRLLAEGDVRGAINLDRTTNALMSCTGRVCAWENQCEGSCVVGEEGDPVRIGRIERFLGDYAITHPNEEAFGLPPRLGMRVAIIGGGPAGLAAAHTLLHRGYDATVFEAWHTLGGVMSYGIPEYVLPQSVIDGEVERLGGMGVEFRTGVMVGRDVTIDELFEQGFDAVFIGTGANKARIMGIPGEGARGFYSARDFLMLATELVLAEKRDDVEPPNNLEVGRRVAVVGAGDTAMDAARTALRLGAEEVTVVYRRSREQSPSRDIEINHTQEEGVKFDYLVNPTRVIMNEDGEVAGLELLRMKLGAPDRSGRPRPEPVGGSEFVMPVDTVIEAIGYDQEEIISRTTPDLEVDRWGSIVLLDAATGRTSKPGVFAGGDNVTGPKTVVHAVAAGRDAAHSIANYLTRKRREAEKEDTHEFVADN